MYHSHVDEVGDTNAGLMGPMIVTKCGQAKPDGSPIDVEVQTNPAHATGSYRCVLSGLQASAAQISHDGNQEGVAIELSTLGCRALFGFPAGQLWDLTLECSTVIGPTGVSISRSPASL